MFRSVLVSFFLCQFLLADVDIAVSPIRPVRDELVEISVSGLPPDSKVLYVEVRAKKKFGTKDALKLEEPNTWVFCGGPDVYEVSAYTLARPYRKTIEIFDDGSPTPVPPDPVPPEPIPPDDDLPDVTSIEGITRRYAIALKSPSQAARVADAWEAAAKEISAGKTTFAEASYQMRGAMKSILGDTNFALVDAKIKSFFSAEFKKRNGKMAPAEVEKMFLDGAKGWRL